MSDGHEHDYHILFSVESPHQKNKINHLILFIHIVSTNIATIETTQFVCAVSPKPYKISIKMRHLRNGI